MQDVRTADFSKPGPPTFSMVPMMICVATPSKYSPSDYLVAGFIAVVIFGLVLLRMLSRRSLADYGD